MVRAAALAGAFFLAGGAIPLIGGVLMMLAPAPIMVYAVGRPSPNLRATIAVLLATAFVAMLCGADRRSWVLRVVRPRDRDRVLHAGAALLF